METNQASVKAIQAAGKAVQTKPISPKPSGPRPMTPSEDVKRSCRYWLATLHLQMAVAPSFGQQTMAALSEKRALSYLDGAHRALIEVLAHRQPDWPHLRLDRLCALLEGPAAVRWGLTDAMQAQVPVPLIMVTPPEDTAAPKPTPLDHLRRRFADRLQPENVVIQQNLQRERAWLDQLVGLLYPSPQKAAGGPSVSTPAGLARALQPMPASLQEKLEEHDIDWQRTCVAELVELVVALQLVA